ncbi:MAG: hypothetical protein ACE5J3_08040 [Methanosarcinales archaeon]
MRVESDGVIWDGIRASTSIPEDAKEYVCLDCENTFIGLETDITEIECPACRSDNVELTNKKIGLI